MALRLVKTLQIGCAICVTVFILFTYLNIINAISNRNSSSNNVIQENAKKKKSFTKKEVSK